MSRHLLSNQTRLTPKQKRTVRRALAGIFAEVALSVGFLLVQNRVLTAENADALLWISAAFYTVILLVFMILANIVAKTQKEAEENAVFPFGEEPKE